MLRRMTGYWRQRSWIILGFFAVVATLATGVWTYGYRQALDQLALQAEADLTLASDRLTTQLQVYQELAVLTASHPVLEGLEKNPDLRPAASALLVSIADKTGALEVAYLDERGNVLATARIAGIQAAKRTGDLIPMCHPLPLDHCEVDFDFPKTGNAIVITSTTRVAARTGVEMEALAAVNLAALTIYDMCKAVDKKMRITNVKLISKTKQ